MPTGLHPRGISSEESEDTLAPRIGITMLNGIIMMATLLRLIALDPSAAAPPSPNLRHLWFRIKNAAKARLTMLNSSLEARVGATTRYIDGFVAAVPTANRETYKQRVEQAAVVFKDHGALKVVECWGDDVPEKLTSFPMAAHKKDDETIVFSWIVWPSRQARDEGMKKVIADLRSQPDADLMPFDGKRLIFGGFDVLVEV
jgi:uncharacterized protein YbaA (DUF1428 family)